MNPMDQKPQKKNQSRKKGKTAASWAPRERRLGCDFALLAIACDLPPTLHLGFGNFRPRFLLGKLQHLTGAYPRAPSEIPSLESPSDYTQRGATPREQDGER